MPPRAPLQSGRTARALRCAARPGCPRRGEHSGSAGPGVAQAATRSRLQGAAAAVVEEAGLAREAAPQRAARVAALQSEAVATEPEPGSTARQQGFSLQPAAPAGQRPVAGPIATPSTRFQTRCPARRPELHKRPTDSAWTDSLVSSCSGRRRSERGVHSRSEITPAVCPGGKWSKVATTAATMLRRHGPLRASTHPCVARTTRPECRSLVPLQRARQGSGHPVGCRYGSITICATMCVIFPPRMRNASVIAIELGKLMMLVGSLYCLSHIGRPVTLPG